ncbi:hypothetical protein [uncultured Sphingomonas sp.]|uniref:hypothetical protein n=1 Tax=uncultured Sphingomonas sp. TaxID=158754 RepID=UPI0035CB8A89
MRNLYKLLAVAAVSLPACGWAQGAEQRFTRSGVTYIYSVTPDAKGRQVIDGRSLPGGSQFHLVVDGDLVDGVSGGQHVTFPAPRGGAVTLAAR